jgi:hypothetical protein
MVLVRLKMSESSEFPKFKCLITNTMEEYDSGVWEFFRHYDCIISDFGQLMIIDNEWRENYVKLMRYYSDLGSSIILKRDAPDPGFLAAFLSKEIEDTDEEDVLLRAKSSTVGYLLRMGSDLEMLMAEFIRLSRIPRFSGNFTVDKFEGIRLLAKVFYSRGIEKSKQ